MLPGLNPKKMNALMKQMGISQDEIPADRVIIEKPDGRIIIDNPAVIKIGMQGNESFQVSGDIREEPIKEETDEESEEEKLEADVAAVVEKTCCSRDIAATELEKCDGDIAQAIINLSKK